jgi:hypothetical protein
MGTAWVLAAIAAAVAAVVSGRGPAEKARPDDRIGLLENAGADVREGLAPGSDGSSDDTRPSAHAPASAARLDWNA